MCLRNFRLKMEIKLPLQDGQSAEITRKGEGHVSLKLKDAKDKVVEIFLSDDNKGQLIGALKII